LELRALLGSKKRRDRPRSTGNVAFADQNSDTVFVWTAQHAADCLSDLPDSRHCQCVGKLVLLAEAVTIGVSDCLHTRRADVDQRNAEHSRRVEFLTVVVDAFSERPPSAGDQDGMLVAEKLLFELLGFLVG